MLQLLDISRTFFKSLAKVTITRAQPTCEGLALNVGMEEQIQLASVALPAAAASILKSGKVKPLAVTSSQRVAPMPKVRTVAAYSGVTHHLIRKSLTIFL